MNQKQGLCVDSRMNPLLYGFLRRVGGAWMLLTSIVGGIDAYNGLNCTRRVGGYIRPFPADSTEKQQIIDAAIAVPYGLIRGPLYNFGQSLNMEGACGAESYTMRFGTGLANLFNSNGMRVFYLINQGVLGTGGAMIGGLIAEEVHVFSRPPAKVGRLTP